MTRAELIQACPQIPPNKSLNAINAPLNVPQEGPLFKKKQSPLLVPVLPKTFKLHRRFHPELPLELKLPLNHQI